MRFTTHKRRQAPAVIIISLIDVLIVVLIFLIVTTTFKQQPAVKLALPESRQQKKGANENALVLTMTKDGPLFLKTQPVTLDRLQEELTKTANGNPEAILAISADQDVPFGRIVKVMDAAKAANIQTISAFTKAAK